MTWRILTVACLTLAVLGCGSSSGEPVDPLASEYCAACSELATCERVVDEALGAACPEQTRDYYQCLTDADCETTTCDAEWTAREACMGMTS